MIETSIIVKITEKLKEVFDTKDIEYYGISWQTDHYTFFVKCEKIDGLINEKWSKNFPSGSYFGIAKRSVSPDYLNLTVDVTKEDAKQFEVIAN